MKTLQGRGIIEGRAQGRALVSRTPINFTASLTKIANLLPGRASQVQDRHHELFKQKLAGKVLVFPACIGSTYTGMVLLELMHKGQAPKALIVQAADPLLVSGSVLAETWYGAGIPIVEYPGPELFEAIENGERVRVDGITGLIQIG